MATEKQIEAGKKNLAKSKKDFTSETAKKAQKKSVAQRKENRTLRQIYEDKLEKGTRKADIVDAVLTKAETGDIAAYDRMVRELGEQPGAGTDEKTIVLRVSTDVATLLKQI